LLGWQSTKDQSNSLSNVEKEFPAKTGFEYYFCEEAISS
jgi:hypothetical protein